MLSVPLKARLFPSVQLSTVLLLVVLSLIVSSEGRYCYSDSNCSPGEVCCNSACKDAYDCLGSTCNQDSDCSTSESCCNNECTFGSDCLGSSCNGDYDCKSWESCCEGTCVDSGECFPFVIIGSTIGAIIFICLLSLCICLICRRRRSTPRNGRVIVGRRVVATTTTSVSQSNPPCHGQAPPSYQQGYSYYPPPQYPQYQQSNPPPYNPGVARAQHQQSNPPPYNPGAARAPEQPPPYAATAKEESGGVYTPRDSYGAIPNPSAPTV